LLCYNFIFSRMVRLSQRPPETKLAASYVNFYIANKAIIAPHLMPSPSWSKCKTAVNVSIPVFLTPTATVCCRNSAESI